MNATPVAGEQAETAEVIAEVRVFVQRFSSTPRGASAARREAMARLARWGVPRESSAAESAELIVAELAANAVTHGAVAGRDAELRVTLVPGTLRIEVTDTRAERRPPDPGHLADAPTLAESGRGLRLVEALADRWEVRERPPVGKTVWAELDLPGVR
ncbi:ATP-binding protein [Streptomyces sp. PTM05]|uniref:ATP-binding protein n=1 Tax=Streptantibioticus parmotrematis TaxID=2873249 RepID=A0ABS7R0Y7_9ACTN|nr:ATP-binding protein [Streptantibioticus parmotrematis]MBY8888631.1 ATP-binding protein [Streptantibioticus parmotrematis]